MWWRWHNLDSFGHAVCPVRTACPKQCGRKTTQFSCNSAHKLSLKLPCFCTGKFLIRGEGVGMKQPALFPHYPQHHTPLSMKRMICGNAGLGETVHPSWVGACFIQSVFLLMFLVFCDIKGPPCNAFEPESPLALQWICCSHHLEHFDLHALMHVWSRWTVCSLQKLLAAPEGNWWSEYRFMFSVCLTSVSVDRQKSLSVNSNKFSRFISGRHYVHSMWMPWWSSWWGC